MKYIVTNSIKIFSNQNSYGFFQDAPVRQNLVMRRYFEKNFDIFLDCLKTMRQLKRPLTPEEEKEFKFMMEALVEAKNSTYDFEKSKS